MFITFEGVEGAGKGTMITRTVKWLRENGQSPILTREPGGCRLGKDLRSILLHVQNADLTPEAELFLYLADRAQHVAELILPALNDGKTVISDRYADSTIVYQGFGRELDIELLFDLNNLAIKGLWPDLTFVLDLAPEEGLKRALERNKKLGLSESEGRFEAEALAFHEKIRNGYREWARRYPERIKLVNASGTPDEVFAQIEELLKFAHS